MTLVTHDVRIYTIFYFYRYTANDPCNSRCQYLYKDHYHCKVEGCLVLFKSKDGVREHARYVIV